MNIPAVNNLNLLSVFQTKQNNANANYSSRFGLKMAQPLTKDTVSFGAVTDHFNYKRKGISEDAAKKVEALYNHYKPQVDAIFTLLLASLMVTKETPNHPVEYISSRAKSWESAKEKSEANGWTTEEEVKQKMTDLMGGKIVLNIASKENVDKVIDNFCNAIDNKQIRLRQIENKVPKSLEGHTNEEIEEYSYPTLESLKKLYETGVKNGNNPEYDLEKPFDFSRSNYTALHILFDVLVKNSDDSLQWVTIECQITGHDVAKHKDFDDVIFKLLNGKKVNKKYHKITEILTPYIMPKNLLEMSYNEVMQLTNKNFEDMKFEHLAEKPREQLWANILVRREFDKYRAEIFIQQREKEPIEPQERCSELEAFAYPPPNPRKYPHLCRHPRLYMGYLYRLKQQADNEIPTKKK